MKAFEKEIKRRLMIKILFSVIGGAAILTAMIIKLTGNDASQGINGFSMSVLIGVFCGVEVFSVPPIIRYRKVLKDKEALKTLHINETDERNQMVESKTCRTCFYAALTLLGYSSLIAALFSETVFYTLGTALLVLCIMYLIVKVIYTRNSYK